MKPSSAPPSLPGTRPEGVESEAAAADYIRQMFTEVAPRYDFLNHLLSLGFDRAWRRRTAGLVREVLAWPEARAIDLCCGTGDLALELARLSAGLVVGSDFCAPMLTRAQDKARWQSLRVPVLAADTLALPFADGSFDVATVAFGFRNLANYRRGLEEIQRVLKPGGVAAILEFSVPQRSLFKRVYSFYFRQVLPRVGNRLAGVHGAYAYLPASVEKFPSCDEFAQWMRAAGFVEVSYRRWTAGTVALHLGKKAAG